MLLAFCSSYVHLMSFSAILGTWQNKKENVSIVISRSFLQQGGFTLAASAYFNYL